MVKKILKPKHKTRKKLWWTAFLVPIIFAIGGEDVETFFMEDIPSRTIMLMEVEEESAGDIESTDPIIEETPAGWLFYDRLMFRVRRDWELIFSIALFFLRRKIVGEEGT